MDYERELLGLYNQFPFEQHPFWQGVLNHELTYDQVIQGEVQHYLRTRSGRLLRREALDQAEAVSPKIFDLLLQTYLEECTEDKTGPTHLDLVKRLVIEGGISEAHLDACLPTPGNSAAIALYRDITRRGAACHMLGAGIVENYYSQLCPKIFNAYVKHYGMTAYQAETYEIHGPMDEVHASRALQIVDEAVEIHGWTTVYMAVRDAFVATSLHYDGMFQAAVSKNRYWNGAL